MKTNLQIRGYNAVINRGCITPKTIPQDFIDKIKEESLELFLAFENNDIENLKEEITDLKHTCDNFLIYMGFEPDKELLKVVLKNEKRASHRQGKKQSM